MKLPEQKKKLKQSNTRNIIIICVLFCLITGCAHGKKGGAPERVADPIVTEQVDTEDSEDIAFDSEDEDDFFDDDEDLDALELQSEKKLVSDPLYYFNKGMYHFNDKLYFWVLKPSAKAYKKVTPGFFRVGVKNFFKNLGMPLRFTSCLLQGKVKGAGSEIGRFLVNTTLGFAGVIDTAELSFKIKERDEDLGQVLGSYGIGNGFYLYLPFLGPSTLRDSVGMAGGAFLDPMKYTVSTNMGYSLTAYSTLNSVSFAIGNYEAVKSAS